MFTLAILLIANAMGAYITTAMVAGAVIVDIVAWVVVGDVLTPDSGVTNQNEVSVRGE